MAAAFLLISRNLARHFVGGRLLRKGDGWAELVFLGATASIAVATPVLVALALLGWFVTPAVVGVLLVCAAALWTLLSGGMGPTITMGRWDLAFFGLVAGAFALYARPAEYVINDRDPGVYALVAAKLARTGELLSRDPLVGAVVPFHHFTAWAKYPGFYIYGDDLIVPQFFPGPFVWLGLGNLLGGVWGGLYVVPVLGALSVGALFLLGRELFGRWAGFLGAALLAVSYAQVWWSRHPSSEVMAQFFVLGGLFCGARFLNGMERGNGLLAGLLLGGAMLVRADAFLALAVLPVLVGRDLLLRRPLKPWLPLIMPVALLGGVALLYANTVGGRYLHLIYDRHGLDHALQLAPYVLGFAFLGAATLWSGRRRLDALGRLLKVRAGSLAFVAALALVVAAFWAYFFLPEPWENLPDDTASFNAYDRQAAVRLVWVATPVVAGLGLAGFLLAARRVTAARLLLLGAVASFAVFYVAMPNVAPDLPWASRRFVPTVLPGLCLLAGYAIVVAGRMLGRSTLHRLGVPAAGLLAAVALALSVQAALPVYGVRELGGMVESLERVEAQIPESSVVYVGSPGDDYASALDYLHGRPVLYYDEESFGRELPGLRKAGLLQDAVYIKVDGYGAPIVPGLKFREAGREEIVMQRLSPTLKSLPWETYEKRVVFSIYEIEER
jgi:hypothetical protein